MTDLREFPSFELRLLTHLDACYAQAPLMDPADLLNLGDSNRALDRIASVGNEKPVLPVSSIFRVDLETVETNPVLKAATSTATTSRTHYVEQWCHGSDPQWMGYSSTGRSKALEETKKEGHAQLDLDSVEVPGDNEVARKIFDYAKATLPQRTFNRSMHVCNYAMQSYKSTSRLTTLLATHFLTRHSHDIGTIPEHMTAIIRVAELGEVGMVTSSIASADDFFRIIRDAASFA
ncbi:uncharacterized protein M421DRAFT_92706 [Didymella exigua CBS 183.55]|uniref:Uncharacterized protein n=1 Tax=Didymella exigua CBS 183.55 TaxID=1150837 RepID=A0A6A5RKM8_9PLEO|nr:uncharacterized protein M421DRAFT_92706 [Didymella exigua CBS 183.55]KAF1927830.1 hypothetical protein M421DRAFT_92706 [Didymella exigua CBS 183.55]